MTETTLDLADLGWGPFFQSQLTVDESVDFIPMRVMEVHRGQLDVTGAGFAGRVPAIADEDELARAAVGDWVLLSASTGRPVRILARKSLFKRKAPGTGRSVQLLAANVDTLFVVSSCNLDFNVARLERYLALARDADVMPVVVLTKADLAEDARGFAAAASQAAPGLLVECVDARDPADVACLHAWCGLGQTVALVGSSGVGKSTLVNTLTGSQHQATQAIRADDDRGRHTTTTRSMNRLPAGGWLLDMPGIRELQLTDVASGLEDLFADIIELAASCRFSDCRHEKEPGCAILEAIGHGQLEPARFARYSKLRAEEALNTGSLGERHRRSRTSGKVFRSAQAAKRHARD